MFSFLFAINENNIVKTPKIRTDKYANNNKILLSKTPCINKYIIVKNVTINEKQLVIKVIFINFLAKNEAIIIAKDITAKTKIITTNQSIPAKDKTIARIKFR